MQRRHLLISLPALPLAGCAAAPVMRKLDAGTAAREVDAAERAFAKTMADRDLAAFSGWIADDAVFINGREPLVGRDAITAFWARFFERTEAPFAWAPDQVVALADGSLAWSEGPVTNPEGAVILRFQSVWRRSVDGTWQVVFDQGHSICAPTPDAAAS